MRFSLSTFALSLLVLQSPLNVEANTPLNDCFVQFDMSLNKGYGIALASRPMWHFGLLDGNKPCYPSAALVGGQQHGTNPDIWPNAGTGCADPGPVGKGNPFPTYYTSNFCGNDEIRVVYSLYFTHDGFLYGGVADGHMHDWERIIVIWRRENCGWIRKELLRSYHSGYMRDSWENVPSTINYDHLAENNGKNKDGAKIYVGWAKHTLFANPNTSWKDKASQGCGREFRSSNWWYIPEPSDLICAGNGCLAGTEMASFDWGSADSGPWVVADGACAAAEGGNLACKYIDQVLPP